MSRLQKSFADSRKRMRIPDPGQLDDESPKTRRKSPKAAPLGAQDLNVVSSPSMAAATKQ